MDSRVASAGGLGLLMHRAPVPSINHYIILSIFISTLGTGSLWNTFNNHPELHSQLADELRSSEALSQETTAILAEYAPARILYYVISNQAHCWILINSFYALLALAGKIIVHHAFGDLTRQERAVSRASLLTCIVFDAVFLSVVSGNQTNRVLLWMIWFAVTAFFTVLNQIVHQRFKYISPSGGFPGTGVFLVCSLILTISTGVLVGLAWHADLFTLSTFLFLAVDAVLAWLRSGRGVFRCLLAAANVASNTARSLSYTTDMLVGVTTELIQLLHFLHLMFFSPVGFNLTCIFFFYHMKMAYSSIVATLNRYLKHRAIFRHIAQRYPRLEEPSDELCIVCWEKLEDARKLECGHAFHDWCLMWWLEQDASCPTCRRFLPSPHEQARAEGGVATAGQPSTTTWHFSGERFSGFGGFLRLPSFSIELSHNMGVIRRDDSQLNTQAEQVREMFPQLPFDVILNDLRTSGSSQATIENILEGRVGFVPGMAALEESDMEVSGEESGGDSGDEEGQGRFSESDALPTAAVLAEPSMAAENGRGTMVAMRRREMILKYRRRYIESTKGDDLRRKGIAE
ncbi:hypothetical protein PENTCL1PPCAC_21889 [Pristionchus entomophagus]|uniref:Hrdl-1 n=1 Tax=Pristionchus entomophagus TaxID=358040 RepID=A0AAV5U0L5_9BILA|nr:hypothetical protein PENTCL1PPCAC_21889 [Pristionchus entomophagus]